MTSTARRTTFNLQGFFAECEMRTVVGESNRLRSIDIHLFSVILNYWIKMVEGLNNNESTKWREPFWNERRKNILLVLKVLFELREIQGLGRPRQGHKGLRQKGLLSFFGWLISLAFLLHTREVAEAAQHKATSHMKSIFYGKC